MYTLGRIVKWLGWAVAVVPLVIVIAMSAYIWFANPADQAGWGAGLFGAIMIMLFAVPAGLVLASLGWIMMNWRAKPPAPPLSGESGH